MSQGWVWRELEQYKTRICEIGVDGPALYNLEGVVGRLCNAIAHMDLEPIAQAVKPGSKRQAPS